MTTLWLVLSIPSATLHPGVLIGAGVVLVAAALVGWRVERRKK